MQPQNFRPVTRLHGEAFRLRRAKQATKAPREEIAAYP